MTDKTDMSKEREALRLAEECETGYDVDPRTRSEIAAELRRLHAQVATLTASQPVAPAGFAMVPMDATDAMMAAFAKAAAADVDWHGATEAERQEVRDGFGPAYRAMLAAAPQPSPTPQADPLQPVVSLQEQAGMYADDFAPQTDSQPDVDLIARGMRWEDCEALMKESCAQAGVQWDEEKEPQSIAINVMQRLANAAHKVGFKLGLERMAAARAPADSVTAPAGGVVAGRSVAVGPVGLEWLIEEINKLPTVRASEIDGEESDGTPQHWRNRPHVSLRKLERLLREFFTPPPAYDEPTQAQVSDLQAALNEADRRAGAAERTLAECKEDLDRLARVRDRMKEQWGVHRNVSFDVVWDEALALKVAAPTPPAQAADSVLEDVALSPAEADLLEKAISDFEECGETDVPDAALRRFAAAGYLECVHYHVIPTAQDAIDAARKQGANHD